MERFSKTSDGTSVFNGFPGEILKVGWLLLGLTIDWFIYKLVFFIILILIIMKNEIENELFDEIYYKNKKQIISILNKVNQWNIILY